MHIRWRVVWMAWSWWKLKHPEHLLTPPNRNPGLRRPLVHIVTRQRDADYIGKLIRCAGERGAAQTGELVRIAGIKRMPMPEW